MTADLRSVARKRLGLFALFYFAVTAVLVVVNVVTHGPTWWYFAAAGVGTALGFRALQLRR
ncbi:MAG TPA: 2TM domain-containing protein [Polyangiaceae bacterium]